MKYKDMNFVWIEDHYDIHLEGLCKHKGELCRFTTEYDTMVCTIYPLSIFGKLRWLFRKKLFELCVGYHWTYKQKVRQGRFYYRKPIWFYKLLFKIYYMVN